MNNIKQATIYAKECTKGRQRLNGEPFIEHILRIYKLLKYNNINDRTTLLATLLHHCSDDENSKNDEFIKQAFGDEVYNLLQSYKKIKKIGIDAQSINSFNEKYIYQTFINLAGDIRLIVIRVADKYDNLQNSWVLTPAERLAAASKVLYLYAPLAKMVGLGKLSAQMEDDAFRIINPREFFQIKKIRSKNIRNSNKILNDTSEFIRQILKDRDINCEINIRFKHIYSIYRKKLLKEMQSGSTGTDLEYVHDLVGMRIIVEEVGQCYEVESILDTLWEQDPSQRSDDLIKPRPSGYRSLHTYYMVSSNLGLEIQIRTFEMHNFNEYGPASHLLYKVSQHMSEEVKEEFSKYMSENPSWFKNLNFWDIQTKIQGYKPSVPFSKNVYVFTPKGDIIELPRGSKVLDFAYKIHSDLGNYCNGCYINGKFSKLDYEIQDGDLIKILTNNKPVVNRDWLGITYTKYAKINIKKALNTI
ncbi:hypothetical protein A2V49_03715 [candidate division WWE3 bacterium RBG_19FT_COMBO_34_6]|uniref:TGS domain-containing protein n=1 Tax=candidate division WWE3 bacterium RBG_19FT_COMBO_34_6 TaxID=1802612 RepID=A0A1F4UL03_UNCKA|nr:MAG: hypothetical protein A2V49_03715 [candidate division WWE3 bacterium RBG_19FT_COMBO_34_6]